jgi:hypothetical protein
MGERVHEGKKDDVISELEILISGLKGTKLLSVIQYKQDLLKRD